MKKLITVIMFFLLSLSMYVNASGLQTEQVSQDSNGFIISGKCQPNDIIGIIVIRKQDENINFIDEEIQNGDKIIFIDDMYSDNGEFKFIIPISSMDAASGTFKYIISSSSKEESSGYMTDSNITQIYIQHINTKNALELFESLENPDNTDIYETCGFNMEGYNLLTKEQKTEFTEHITSTAPHEQPVNAFNNELIRMEFNLLNQPSDLYEFLNKYSFEFVQDSNYLLIKEKGNVDEFYKKLLEQRPIKEYDDINSTALYVAKNMADELNDRAVLDDIQNAGYNEIKNKLDEYEQWLGFKFSDKTKKVSSLNMDRMLNEIIEIEAKDKTDFINCLNKIINKYIPVSSGGNDSSGGNSSSSGTSSGNSNSANKGNSTGLYIPAKEGTEPVAEENSDIFNDLQGYDWAKKEINELYRRNIINGTGNNTFDPGAELTREAAVKIIINACNLTNTKLQEVNFSDVDKTQWYYEYIKTAYSMGIVYGDDTGTFGIGNSVTRQDFVVMLYRAIIPDETVEKSLFADRDDIADYAGPAIDYFAAKNIVNGYETQEGNVFMPTATITRAEAAKIIYEVVMNEK